jgi:hypothetical protein
MPFFYVSRVTNLTTPRSAPDYSTNKYWQNESMQNFVNHSFMLRILSVMILNTIYPSLYSNFQTENDSWFNNSTNKYVQNESMQNFCVHPFILRIVHVMILNITCLIAATLKKTGGLTIQPTSMCRMSQCGTSVFILLS